MLLTLFALCKIHIVDLAFLILPLSQFFHRQSCMCFSYIPILKLSRVSASQQKCRRSLQKPFLEDGECE